MSVFLLAGVAWAVVGGVLAPGLWLVRRFDLGRGPLERAAIAAALGRITLGSLTLIATTLGVPALVHVGAAVALAALFFQARSSRYPRATDSGAEWHAARWPLALGIFAALLLVHATVGRSGLAIPPDGTLLFFGRDLTFDPLAHIAAAHHLIGSGLPLEISFVAGTEFTHSYLPVGVRAGFALLSGGSLLEVVFRWLPLLDLFALGLVTTALVRSLGGGVAAATLGTGLMMLGSGADFLLPLLEPITGNAPAGRDTWSFFGPYLLGANSVTAGLHTWFAALLLLRGAEGRRGPAIAAGALVAACFEIKLFLWAAALPALVGLALWSWRDADARAGAALRVAAIAGVVCSVPSLIEKAWWAVRLAATGEQGFGLCLGCLPRYLASGAMTGELPPFEFFARFDSMALLQRPTLLLDTVVVSVGVVAIVLGARLWAVPQLLRGARDSEPGVAQVHRLAGLAALLGIAGACAVRTSPHYLNAAEFAWIATFGLWPFVALALAAQARSGRWLRVAAGMLLALPGTGRVIGPLGYGAPVVARLAAPDYEFLLRLREVSAPGEVVVEPSILDDLEVPSAVTWISGRPAYLTNRSAAAALPKAEAQERYENVVRIFTASDPAVARAALSATGARWVYAPAHRPLPPELAATLSLVLESPAGTAYRVKP